MPFWLLLLQGSADQLQSSMLFWHFLLLAPAVHAALIFNAAGMIQDSCMCSTGQQYSFIDGWQLRVTSALAHDCSQAVLVNCLSWPRKGCPDVQPQLCTTGM